MDLPSQEQKIEVSNLAFNYDESCATNQDGLTYSQFSTGILSVFAILLSIAFIAQLASIFMVIEVRTTIVLGEYGGTDVVKVLQKYGIDRGVTSEWVSCVVYQNHFFYIDEYG